MKKPLTFIDVIYWAVLALIAGYAAGGIIMARTWDAATTRLAILINTHQGIIGGAIGGLFTIIAAFVAWRGISAQIAAAREDTDRQLAASKADNELARKAIVSGQNQDLIRRLNDLAEKLNYFGHALEPVPTVSGNASIPALKELSIDHRAGIDIDQIDALWSARIALSMRFSGFLQQRSRDAADAGASKEAVMDAIQDMHAVMFDLVMLLNSGWSVAELRLLGAEELHEMTLPLRID